MTTNVVFVLYEDDQSGKNWVACACGRWLHEECADDCIIDSDGNERLCFMSESPVNFCHFFSLNIEVGLICSYCTRLLLHYNTLLHIIRCVIVQ